MILDYDPIPVLQSVGYTEREAAFLYLVAVHSGYFLRRQYARFIQRERGAIATQLLRKAIGFGHLQRIACGQSRFVYHLSAKEVYDAAGLSSSRHRRLKGDAEIKCRLMVLDFVLDHLEETLLDLSEAKCNFFLNTPGINESILPRSRGVAFPEGFPLIVGQEQKIQFTYFDEGALSTSALETFLSRYCALFGALPAFELLYLADTNRNFERARRFVASRFPQGRALGITPMTPLGVDHFLEYLRVHARYEKSSEPIPAKDAGILRDGKALYSTLEHRALIAAWLNGGTREELIRRRFRQQGPQTTFTPMLVPYRYPLYQFRRERESLPNLGASHRASAMPLFEE
jgi:hypothetical protein